MLVNTGPGLHAVVRAYSLATAAILVLFSALACVTGWWTIYKNQWE